jgi:peptidyl-prolyl cis-trans isomerase A (cyclophilin A)
MRFARPSGYSAPVRRLALVALALGAVGASAACGGGPKKAEPPPALLQPKALTARAPQRFDATFKTSKGDFTVTVHRSWAPRGADRFYNLVRSHFFDGVKFFRVVPGFVVQFGISPDPHVSAAWRNATIADDPVTEHNVRGTVTFATAGPGTRTTQVFVNLVDNVSLDSTGFAPFAAVTKGMSVFDRLYSGYGEAPGLHQSELEAQGNAWLDKHYPKLDEIVTARLGGG